MSYHCKRCKKPLPGTTFFCPECEEQSIQKLAQMMEEKKKGTGQLKVCPVCKGAGELAVKDDELSCWVLEP